MCGIWALFGINGDANTACFDCFFKIKHRGPDAWRIERDAREPMATLGFHRLTIVDTLHGMQPMKIHQYPRVTLICNGEIYNCKRLREQYNFCYETRCDVEAVIHCYKHFSIAEAVKKLDGVFAFCLVDGEAKKIYLARDPYGVRPLFKLQDAENGVLGICSEAKGLVGVKPKLGPNATLAQFPPGHIEVWDILESGKVKLNRTEQYFKPGYPPSFKPFVSEDELKDLDVYQKTAYLLEAACKKRLMSDRRIGCLLSGGLDSSLVTALVVKLAKQQQISYKIQTFAIGMGDSPDLAAARIVADHLGTEHHEIKFDENDVKAALDDVIYHLESFDITTIRASLPMYLLSKYIKEKTDTTVIFSGEGADELAQGYIYFRDAPSEAAGHEESIRLLSDIYLYDGLRADRTTSAQSLEPRVPFLDIQFTNHYLNVDAKLKTPQNGVEKHLLRQSFANSGLLPDSILWRHKEAFSDGVASVKKSLFTTIDEIIRERFSKHDEEYPGTQPTTVESKYYRHVFEKSFPGQYNFTPYYWMPKWVQVSDPSARFIKHYAAKEKLNYIQEYKI
ncbi:asparagine synthetase [glutamine-hydrolyzing] [Aricia agestis]|uniref:asparagine synthetase [glutamine-hydrolyzing] n=1 Tax=Aricia agestis TaxID=91739 RepID=UPI001C2034B7|nr:asparagine synthetase [glutamine-hydrolyzing] [Aricia agestis]XP_041979784.1 asparagine synthetase [glutamine-hydrolyzing] [Aricia agestis]